MNEKKLPIYKAMDECARALRDLAEALKKARDETRAFMRKYELAINSIQLYKKQMESYEELKYLGQKIVNEINDLPTEAKQQISGRIIGAIFDMEKFLEKEKQ